MCRYCPVTVSSLREDEFTDREIKELLLSSKAVTSKQIEKLLEMPIVKRVESRLSEEKAAGERIKKSANLKPLLLPICLSLIVGAIASGTGDVSATLFALAGGFGFGVLLLFINATLNPTFGFGKTQESKDLIDYIHSIKDEEEFNS